MTDKKSTDQQTADANFARAAADSTALADTMSTIKKEQFSTNQLLGRIQATHSLSVMMEGFTLSQLQSVKNEKLYRNLQGQKMVINGTSYDLGTWDGFCRAIGSGRSTVDQKLLNLHVLGEVAFENSQDLGFGVRDLRKLRKLDPTDQAVIVGELEANIGDKESIIELIEDMSAKHVKDKEDKDKKIAELEADREAIDKVLADKNKRIDKLLCAIKKEENVTFDEKVKGAFFNALTAQNSCLAEINHFETVIQECLGMKEETLSRLITYYLLNIRSSISDLIQDYGLDYSLIDKDIINELNQFEEWQLGLGDYITPEDLVNEK